MLPKDASTGGGYVISIIGANFGIGDPLPVVRFNGIEVEVF